MLLRNHTRNWLFGSKRKPIRREPKLTVTPLEPRTVPAFLGGANVAVGDVNGDGLPDIVVGQATGGGLVEVIDGATGKTKASFAAYEPSFTGGVYVAVGDIDGDGIDDIVTGTGNGGGPNVKIFDGEGKEKASFYPYEDTFRGGVIVAVGDVNRDGKAEIITGTGVGGGPRVQVIDGTTHQSISNFFAYEDTFRGGVLVGVADSNGDGKKEVVTGTGVGGGPRVQVFDAATQKSLLNFFAYPEEFRGGVLAAGGDLSGDGKDEIITGTGPGGGPVVTAFDPASLKSVGQFAAFDENFRGGVSVAAGDFNSDGKYEIVAGAGPGGSQVGIFTSDGSKALQLFNVFDPDSPPGTPISTLANAGTHTFDPASLAKVGLHVSSDQILVGANSQLAFTARTDSGTPTRVQLFEGDAAGNPGASLFDLFDDGVFTHRDSFAKDGTFSNSFTVNYPTPQTKTYVAVVTVGGTTVNFSTQVTAIAAPSTAQILANNSVADNAQSSLDSLIASGTSESEALSQVASQLRTTPGVIGGSVVSDNVGIFWRTPDGLNHGISTTDDNPNILGVSSGNRAPSPPEFSPTAGAVDVSVPFDPDSKGKALFLSPYYHQFTGNDPVTRGPGILSKQYESRTLINPDSSHNNLVLRDFKDIGQNDIVVITSHGTLLPQSTDPDLAKHWSEGALGLLINSGEIATVEKIVEYLPDIIAERVIVAKSKIDGVLKDTFRMTPAFFAYYSGKMNESLVILENCHSTQELQLRNVFFSLGAQIVAGFDDEVHADFATIRTLDVLQHIVNGGTIGTIPGDGRVDPLVNNFGTKAEFTVYFEPGIASKKFLPKGKLLKDYDIQVDYTWANTQKDLDTGTAFIGGSVGYSQPGSIYIKFPTGDNTSTGGLETAIVDIDKAFRENKWNESVEVTIRAGWFKPAKGSGPATVTVSLRKKDTGELFSSISHIIDPGEQDGGATTVVGQVIVYEEGRNGNENVFFTYS